MSRSGSIVRGGAAAVALALIAAGCTSDDKSSESATTTAGTRFSVAKPTDVGSPPAAGKGLNHPQPSPALPDGYEEEEFFVSGTATSFDPVETPRDGKWAVKAATTAPYRTRVIVRRPTDPERFSGTVALEWLNVSAIEASPDWAYLHEELARNGDVYVGVSAQAQGVNGGDTLLNVDVNSQAASQAGVDATAAKSGLRNIDPERYGTLEHPGDAYSYDMFSQIGAAVKDDQGDLLGGLKAKSVVALGESQSAAFLTSYVNAVHPLDPVFDGFFIHSRGAYSAPFDGKVKRPATEADMADAAVKIRTDLDVPVFMFETETDLTLLGYALARQPDTDLVRTWEVAGTSHADYYQIASVIGGSRDPSLGSFLGCSAPINVGPQREVIQAAFHGFRRWVTGGAPPVKGEEIATARRGDSTVIERDDDQLAVGGVRNPLVDVPVVATIGDPPGGATISDMQTSTNSVCLLFGQTIPFDQAKLTAKYGSADDYVDKFRTSADSAVDSGFLLRPTADQLVTEAEANRQLFTS